MNGIFVKSAIRSAIRASTNLLFPPRCVHCGADGNLFCQTCVADSIRLMPSEMCRRCALPSAQNTCEACFLEQPALNRAIAAYAFDPAIRDAVTSFKYNDIRALAPRLARLLVEALPESVRNTIDVLVPVPMSRSRLRHRGYNQSELLAMRVSQIADVPLETHTLTRLRDSGSQAGAQSLSERTENMIDAFEVSGEVAGWRVLLIDDVMTTGSTLNACAKALKEAGADWVGALVLAREL